MIFKESVGNPNELYYCVVPVGDYSDNPLNATGVLYCGHMLTYYGHGDNMYGDDESGYRGYASKEEAMSAFSNYVNDYIRRHLAPGKSVAVGSGIVGDTLVYIIKGKIDPSNSSQIECVGKYGGRRKSVANIYYTPYDKNRYSRFSRIWR